MIREKIIEICVSQIGVTEFPANSNNVKYNTWFYGHEVFDGDKLGAHYPWCGTSVSWIYNESGRPLGTIDYRNGFAGCPYAVEHVSKWGKIVTIPLPGDVVFYDWDGDGKFDHTGIFEKDLGVGQFSAFEGNTSIPKTGTPEEIKKANSNGGIFMRRADRKYKNAIFVRPNVLLDK